MKNKALAMILALVSSTILISILAAIGAGPLLIIIVGLGPALSYSIYFGIKEYRCFFLNSQPSPIPVPDYFRVSNLRLIFAYPNVKFEIDINRLNQVMHIFHERYGKDDAEIVAELNKIAEKIFLEIGYPPAEKQVLNLSDFLGENTGMFPLRACYSEAF